MTTTIKPGYYLETPEGLFGPVVNDNEKRETYTDDRIKRNVDLWAKRLEQKVVYVPGED